MGSLMSGWDSPVHDPKSAKYWRNRSLTKDGVDSYWKLKKKMEEEHLKAISSPSDSNQESKCDDGGLKGVLMRSSSLPEANTKKGFIDMEAETSLEEFIKKNGWWKRSSSAFLNEPPVLEQASNTYATQFHIANSKANNTGISAA